MISIGPIFIWREFFVDLRQYVKVSYYFSKRACELKEIPDCQPTQVTQNQVQKPLVQMPQQNQPPKPPMRVQLPPVQGQNQSPNMVQLKPPQENNVFKSPQGQPEINFKPPQMQNQQRNQVDNEPIKLINDEEDDMTLEGIMKDIENSENKGSQ